MNSLKATQLSNVKSEDILANNLPLKEEIQDKVDENSLVIIHEKWRNHLISTQEYLDAIPEVEI